VPATLPKFARGLKLARIGVFLMLVQLAVAIYVSVRSVSASTPSDAIDAFNWLRYSMVANTLATGAMLVGAVVAIPELARMRVAIGGLVISAIGLAVATIALLWTYHAITSFIDVARDPESSLDDLLTATKRLESFKYVTMTKDFAYGIGLITLLRTVQRSAAASDQIGLRDAAGHQSRALMVMVAGDLFYQLTYGVGGSIGIIGLVGSLLVAGFWIYCHVQLTKFFGNAAYFMNEPHDLPIATVVKVADEKPVKAKATAPARPSQPSRPSRPAIPERPSEPLARVAPPAPPPPPMAPPRAPSSAEGSASSPDDGPRFLR
jgi:hypothetical protein